MTSPIPFLRDAWRSLRGAPLTSLVAIATLAAGIGANAVVFGALRATVFSAPKMPDPDRVLSLTEVEPSFPDRPFGVSVPAYREWETGLAPLANLAAHVTGEYTVSGAGDPQRVHAAAVTASFFEVAGVRPFIGRAFTSTEDARGSTTAVASHAFWRSYFGGDERSLGTTFRFGGQVVTLSGVMPPGFDFPGDASLYVPLAAFSPDRWTTQRRAHVLGVVARLREGTTRESLDAALRVLHAEAQIRFPGDDPGHEVRATTLQQAVYGDLAKPLGLLQTGAALLLVIACVNLAAVLLTRAESRVQEWTVRRALGARPADIARIALGESLALASLGAAAGLVLAGFVSTWFVSLSDPRLSGLRIDPAVLVGGVFLALLAGVLIGLAPAVAALRTDGSGILSSGVRPIGGRGSRRAQSILLGAQVASSLALLVGAGLLTESFRRVLLADKGFHADSLLTVRVSPPPDRYDRPADVVAFFRSASDSLRALPGVQDVGAVSVLPISGPGAKGEVTVEGSATPADKKPAAGFLRVLPGYFRAMGIPLVLGRDFHDLDGGEGDPVVVVTKALAARLFPGRDPIGQRVKVGPPESEPWLRVVGVSGDLSQSGIDAPAEYQTFEPLAQRPRAVMRFALRTGGDPEALARPALAALRALEPAAVLDQLATMDSRIQASLRPRRLQTTLILSFALLSLVITALGVYGVTAATVEQRTREMGLRSALGAGPKEILRFALAQVFVPIGAGLALGLGLSAAMAPALRGLLYGIEPLTPGVHVTAALGLAFIALCASLGPARRALRFSPSEALNQKE